MEYLRLTNDDIVHKWNQNRVPRGSPSGGQFTSGAARTAAYSGDGPTPTAEPVVPYIKMAFTLFSPTIARVYAGTYGKIPINTTPGIDGVYASKNIAMPDVINGMGNALLGVRVDQLDNISKITLTDLEGDRKGGSYAFGSREIQLDAMSSTLNKTAQPPNSFSISHIFKHEIGHSVWTQLTPDQRYAFGRMVGYPDPDELRDVSWYANSEFTPQQITIMNRLKQIKVKSVTDYGTSSVLESWAECFSYVNWNTHKLQWNTGGMDADKISLLESIAQW